MASATTTREITLKLSEKEAEWLRAQLQNPLHGQDIAEESSECGNIRHEIFYTLDVELSHG